MDHLSIIKDIEDKYSSYTLEFVTSSTHLLVVLKEYIDQYNKAQKYRCAQISILSFLPDSDQSITLLLNKLIWLVTSIIQQLNYKLDNLNIFHKYLENILLKISKRLEKLFEETNFDDCTNKFDHLVIQYAHILNIQEKLISHLIYRQCMLKNTKFLDNVEDDYILKFTNTWLDFVSLNDSIEEMKFYSK